MPCSRREAFSLLSCDGGILFAWGCVVLFTTFSLYQLSASPKKKR